MVLLQTRLKHRTSNGESSLLLKARMYVPESRAACAGNTTANRSFTNSASDVLIRSAFDSVFAFARTHPDERRERDANASVINLAEETSPDALHVKHCIILYSVCLAVL